MLLRKMLRDMKVHKTQFISIFLMAFLGVFIYAGIGGEWVGLKKTVDKYYENTNLANIWIYGNGFSKEDQEKVSEISGVTGAERRLSIDSTGDFSNNPKVKLHFIEQNNISQAYVVDGESFDLEKDGVWLDKLFADKKGLKVGDTISFSTNGIEINKKILGTIYSPEYVYASDGSEMVPNHDNYGFAYLSYKYFPEGMNIFYTDLLLTTNNEDYKGIENEVSKTLDNHYSVFLTRENNSSYQMFNEEIKQHKAMGAVFPMAFLAIAMLTILTTMTRIVNNQRTQIGTLKALGFKKRKILNHYISYGFWLSLVGSLLGVVVGPLTLPLLFYPSMKTTYTLPQWRPGISVNFLIMALITVGICTLATYIACRKNLKDTPSESLRPKAPKNIKQGFIEKTKFWQGLGFNAKWNFRDLMRSKLRSIMAIVGVIGCTALLVCAFGMQDSLDDITNWQYKELNKFETKLTLEENILENDIQNIKNRVSGEELMEGAVEINANGDKKSGSITVTEDPKLIKWTDEKRNIIELPKEGISISYKMADILKLKVGDEFKWHVYGDENWITSKVEKIYRDPTNQGISLSKTYFEKKGYKFIPTSIITSQKVEGKLNGVARAWSQSDLTESYETMTEAMNIMVYILILAAAILAVVVLYNLGVLSFTEMERELATLKVIGFKSKKIRSLLLTQNIWLTTIGIIIGIPVGRWLIAYMTSFLGDSFDMMVKINTSTIIYSVLITFLLSIIVNRMFSRKIKKIDMVSSLKGVE